MIATSDGGFLEVGYVSKASTASYDVILIKFDSTGNIEWVGIYSEFYSEFTYEAAESRDGGYLIAGSSYSYGD